MLSTKATSYMAQITGKNHSLDTLPWGMYGFQTVDSSNDHINEVVEVVEEQVTTRAIWAKFKINGQYVWMDKAGLTLDKMTDTRDITYEAKVISGEQTIDSLPKGIYGSQTVANTTDYLNQIVTITKETHTVRGDWVLISQNGKELGWVGKNTVGVLGDALLSTKATRYMAQITGINHSLDTLPWGMYGFQAVDSSNDHIGQTVEIVEERVTTRATWAKFYMNGQYVWMDKVGLTPETMTNSKDVNYEATIVAGGHSIDSLPWGVEGFVSIAGTSEYLNQTVTVTKEAQTPRANWALISYNGTILGWVDIKALQPKTQVKPVIFIDPGHGGSDPGAQYSGVSEKTINLFISNKVKANLEALGYQVIMSRYTDESVGLLQRSIEANESGADIFVSIHHNAMPANATVTGIETYYYEYDPDYQPVINEEMHNDPTRILESAELASAIQNSLVENTGALDRGVRRNTFAVLRETAIPAVLLELGYMSSPTELAKLTTSSYQTTLAKAITVGIVAYFE